jgi:quinol monooxygenase YgiN
MRPDMAAGCCLEIEFTLKPGKRREFSRSFEDLLCHEGEGHIKTTVYEDREEPGHMIWVADWTNRDTIEAYMRSEEFGVLIGGLRVLSTHTSCRLISGAPPRGSEGPAGVGRTPRETTLTLVDLEAFEGPKH